MSDLRHHAVRVPATTANLGPGFDAFGAALDRYLHARTLPRGSQHERVLTTGEGVGEVPAGGDNLVWRSFVAFAERFDRAVPDVALRVANDIPLERGLGSSSAAIVAGLALARAATGGGVGDLQLAALANELEGHPDNVVPAILGGLSASVVADGGELVVRRITPHPRLRPVVLVPESRQNTEVARGVLPDSLGRGEVAAQAARAAHVIGALGGLWPAEPGATSDLLHEPARFRAMASTGDVVAALREAGVHAWLSGAGPSVAAVVPVRDDAVLERIATIATGAGFLCEASAWDLSGASVCPEDGCGISGQPGCVQCPRRGV